MAGIPITAPLTRGTNGTSPFFTTQESDAKLSHVTVDTIAERDAIPEWKRRAKMTCYVVETDLEYRLGINTTIAGQVWTERTFGVPSDVLEEDDILDGDGFIKPELIQNIFLNDSYVVEDEAEMLALTTVTGNFIIRVDTGQVFVKLNNDDPAAIDDFAELTYPGAITSVNGQVGPNVVITLEQLITANPSHFTDAIDANATILDMQAAIAELQADLGGIDLSNKADLVGGTVPLEQLPYSFGSGINLTGSSVALNGDITEEVILNAGNTFDFTLENVPNLTFAATSSISLAYVDGVNDFQLFVDGLAGFRYDQDLSGGFGDNSLITKLYADNRIMGQALGDPNDDRIVFWDDSAGGIRYLDLGTGLSITGTVLSASGGGGGGTWGSIIGTITDQTDLVAYITDQLNSQVIVVVPGTTYDFSASDSGKVVIFTSATGCIANFPAGLPSDFFVDVYVADNAGTINFTVDISYSLESDATALIEKQAASFFFRTATILVGIMGTTGGPTYTNEQAQDAIGSILVDSATIAFVYNDLTPSITASVVDDSVTFAKLQNIDTDRLLGRYDASTGDIQQVSFITNQLHITDDGVLKLGRDVFGETDIIDLVNTFPMRTSSLSAYLLNVGGDFGAFNGEDNIAVLARFTTIGNFPKSRDMIVLPQAEYNLEELDYYDDFEFTAEKGMFAVSANATDVRLVYYNGTEWKALAEEAGGNQVIRYIAVWDSELSTDAEGINFGSEFTGNVDTLGLGSNFIKLNLGGVLSQDITWGGGGFGFHFGDEGSFDYLEEFIVLIDSTIGTGKIELREVSTGSFIRLNDVELLLHTDGALGPYDVFAVDATSGQISMDFSALYFIGGVLEDDTVTKILALDNTDRVVYIDIADIGGGGATLPAVDGLTTGSTVTTSGIERVYLGDTTGGTFTTVLPTAVGNEGYKFTFKKIAGSADWVIDADGTELIDGALTLTLTTLMASITLISDGANWYLI